MKIKRQQAGGVMSIIVFSILVIVGVIMMNSVSNSTSTLIPSSSTTANMVAGNISANTYSAFQLTSVGPIVLGAVMILGIVGMLYLKR